MRLEFRLLGDIAVLVDGHPLDLGGTRQRSVLALLLLQRDHPMATELLADRLWPDDQPLTAIKTIQVYVSRIRRTLGPHADRLSSSATGYRLAVADDELDAARFERRLRQAREAFSAGSPDATLAGLEESLAQWSGPALGDLAGEQFARREAERLEELRLQAFEEMFELRIAAGAGRAAIGELRRMVADQPGRERLWRLLMLALYADDRQGEALEAYHDARRYLADELGLDPSPELIELERAILTQEAPRPKQSALASLSVAAPPPDTELPARRIRRVVTVLRADVVRPSDGELDPELLAALDRRILDKVGHAVERHGGTIDRADHDGVSAVFGLTVAREDDALRAVRAATELRAADDIVLRVGVATGEVLAGPRDGPGPSLTGAPLGVAARLAARAEAGAVLLAADTAALVRGATMTEPTPAGDADSSVSSAVHMLALTEADAIVRRTTTPFVGRAAELDSLVASFARTVSDGMPGLVTVIGAPGVGKSRLVAEAFTRIADRATILRSRCLPYGEGITYWPVRDLVLAAAAIRPGEPRADALAKLSAVVAGSDGAELVRDRVASVVGLADDPAPAEEIRWAVRRFVEALAAERPLVLLVDDLQWAEPVLVELLGHILDLGRGPLLLTTIARPDLEEAHPDWLTRLTLGLTRLQALDESDAATLLDWLAPELPAGPLRARILAAAEGNPLFVEQFVAYLSDEVTGGGRAQAEQAAGALVIPPTIRALLAARLDRLPDPERRLLERAAVIGRTFYGRALAELLPPDERAELPRRLARLARRDLIRPDRSDAPADEAYRFRHLLIRDAAYVVLPKDERAALHETFADWLEARSAANPSEYELIVGYHLEQAYRYHTELGDDPAAARLLADRALALIAPAGQAADERGDPHAAVSLLRRAVDLAPAGKRRIELLIDLEDALWIAGELHASNAARAEVDAVMAGNSDEALEHRRRVAYAGPGGTIEESRAGYAYYERVGDGMGMVRALESLIAAHVVHAHVVDDFTTAADLLDQAIALTLKLGRPDRTGRVVLRAGWFLPDGPFAVPDALARLRRYLALTGGNRSARALILMDIGRLEAHADGDDDWRRRFVEARAIIEDLGLADSVLGAFGYPRRLGVTELAVGDPARVVEMLQDSCSALDRIGDLPSLSTLAPLTAQALLAVGRPDEVERYAYWGKDIGEPDDVETHVAWRMAISGLRSEQSRHDEAIALAREAVAILDGSGALLDRWRANMRLAGAYRAAGDAPAAQAAANEAQRLATERQDAAGLRKIEAFLAAGA